MKNNILSLKSVALLLKTFFIHSLFILFSILMIQFKWAQAEDLVRSEKLSERKRLYQQRYNLNTLSEKLVNNTGDGFEKLYGVRNFRVVLPGVLYRGGANNYYNKNGVRDNMNPLPNEGLQNLCREDFKQAIYLYTTNFSTAPKEVACRNFSSMKNKIDYQQITAFDGKNNRLFMEIIYSVIKGQSEGPIYLHCWNGWHASGLISTLALRQFCGLTASQGLAYWTKNTDGHSKGYDKVKEQIKKYTPYPDLKLSTDEQNLLCDLSI